MTRFSRRLLISVCLGLVLLSAAGVAVLNGYLAVAKKNLIDRINQQAAPLKLACHDIYFVPPNFLYISNAVITDGKDTMMVIPKIRMDVSIPELFSKRFAVSDVHLFKPGLCVVPITEFVRQNTVRVQQLLAAIQSSCGSFSANGIRVFDSVGRGTSDIKLSFREGLFKGRGSFSIPRTFMPFKDLEQVRLLMASSADWDIAGSFSLTKLTVDKLELRGKRFSAHIWGEASKDDLICHGFLLVNRLSDFLPVISIEQKPWYLLLDDQLSSFLGVKKAEQQGQSWAEIASGNGLDLVELDCRLGLDLPRVDLKRFSLVCNNLPLNLKGSLFFNKQFSFDMIFASSLLSRGPGLPYLVNGWMKGRLEGKGLRSDGEIDVNFRQKADGYAPREVRVGFTDALCRLEDYRFYLSTKEARCSVLQNEERRSFRFDDLRLLAYLGAPRYKFFDMYGRYASGIVRGNARLDMKHLPGGMVGVVTLKGAQAQQMAGLDDYFQRLTGPVDAAMKFNCDPARMAGSMMMGKGTLKDMDFFVWLENFFHIPGIGRIDFDSIQTDFWVEKDGFGFLDLSLISNKCDVSGDYGIRNGRMRGKLTLALARSQLQGSKKFIPLLKIIDRSRQRLNFAFQLSGRLEKLNFLWLQSDFKRELENAIPGFVERKIQRDVERMINSLSVE
ncbi:MAG: hypothetical protein ACM3OC_03905 [Deltaproteobacteria bacterium]